MQHTSAKAFPLFKYMVNMQDRSSCYNIHKCIIALNKILSAFYRWAARLLWFSSSMAWWLVSSGYWWRVCICKLSWPYPSSLRGSTSGGTFSLAGVRMCSVALRYIAHRPHNSSWQERNACQMRMTDWSLKSIGPCACTRSRFNSLPFHWRHCIVLANVSQVTFL